MRRAVTWLLGIVLLGFCAVLLLLRFVLLPNVDRYRGDIEQALSQATHLPVSIGAIEGRMQGLRPRLELRQLAIKDAQGRPALSFDNVSGVVGWSSLLALSPRFYWLEVNAPNLAVRRAAGGQLFIAGLPINRESSGPDVSAWVLAQKRIVIRNAQITWSDEMRQAPPLALAQLNLRLERTVLGRHRFGLTALPPIELASVLDLRGEFDGDSLQTVAQWKGELYAALDSIDLAAWHPWFNYPVELTRGRGAAQVWLDFDHLQPRVLTSRLSLDDVQTRLAPELEVLALKKLAGYVQIKQGANDVDPSTPGAQAGLELTTRQLTLTTHDGIVVKPTDLHLQRDMDGGEASVNALDFQTLAALAAYLPLPQHIRQQVAARAPRGSLDKFSVRWRGQQWPFKSYNVEGSFSKLAMASVESQPGFSGISGRIEGNEGSGVLQLAGRSATLTLPTVFEQTMPLDALDARVRWKQAGKETEFELTQTTFRNADAEGVASGRYRWTGHGHGRIDLDARLTRATLASVWRYIPLVAGPHVATFLHDGLTAGRGSEVTLKLKGDLDHFPYYDGNGTFLIKGKINDGVLMFAEGWPQLERVQGELLFSGPGMTITAKDGLISGTRIRAAKAVIPDLGSHQPVLTVDGKTAGATSDFLKFIDNSPVSEMIDHFTQGMSARGNGELDIKLTLPLHAIDESTVAGGYRFDANRLLLDPQIPALDDVRGRLEFTTDSLRAQGVTANVVGMPIKLGLKSQGDGVVLADLSGELNPALLYRQYGYGVLKHLSGSARWSGTVKAHKKSAEVKFSSDLVGISSALPAPFNKSARDPLPLRFERKAADPLPGAKKPRDNAAKSADKGAEKSAVKNGNSERSISDLSIGSVLQAQLLQRQEAGKSILERGLITVGDATARLPERGLSIVVAQPRLNADVWRALLDDDNHKSDSTQTAANANASTSAATDDDSWFSRGETRIDLRTPELQVMSRLFHDVKVVATHAATAPADVWAADINSRELTAKLVWAGGDNPKVSGRIARLVLPDAAVTELVSGEALAKLPNLDLTLDHLQLKGRDYGELRLTAENKAALWNVSYGIRNDDGTLEGKGTWRADGSATPTQDGETKTQFSVQARNLDRFLTRVGYPNTVKRGNAELQGQLSWKGAPQDFELSTLNGQLTLDARNGQFNKLEPGVGRLLGILSLQSLPRRISLDFRDIFSEGFAFDSLKGKVAVGNGVLTTQDMEIVGPAARVQMAGNVDLVNETQDLKIRVQPKLSDSVAAGVLLASPAIGATAWAFNKLFGNPLDNAFAYDYAVSGSLSDPKVEKAGPKLPGFGNDSKPEQGASN